MQTRSLGSTGMSLTPIGLGAWALGGGDWEFGWGPQDDRDSIATIHRALDLGINWIDTAAVYGLGHSERIVGRALRERAEKPYVFTKCSMIWDDRGRIAHNLDPGSIRRELEASLRRLQLEAVDLYQIHWPDPAPEIEVGWETLAALQQEGKARHIGVSNFSVEQMRRVQTIAPIAALQPPYSLVRPEAETELLPFCHEQNIGVIVYSPMMSGLLSGAMTRERIDRLPRSDWRSRHREFQEPRLSHTMNLAEKLRAIGQRHGRSTGEIAIAWTLRRPEVTGAIVGLRRPVQVDEIQGAAYFSLSDAEIHEIAAFRCLQQPS